jgi:hypothetical protein
VDTPEEQTKDIIIINGWMCGWMDESDDGVFYFVLAEAKNRSQAPYIPLERYVP